ncbi:hypothetical protein [Nonomuraea sp. NPDC023979]|uniref:hypothetical protein n=1 Tax=Nonomuraea sp. NPDC023979 TaxID=3154796 RepID=UPI0033C29B07
MAEVRDYWLGVDPHVPAHERVQHAVPVNGSEVRGWQVSVCSLRVALLLHGRYTASGIGGEPLWFDPAVSTCCSECAAHVLGAEVSTPSVPVSTLHPQAS